MISQTNTGNTVKASNTSNDDVLGIDIGSSSLRACIVNKRNIVNFFEVESNGVQNGFVTDVDAFEDDVFNLILKINDEVNVFPKKIVLGISTRSQNSNSAIGSTIIGRADGIILENDIEDCIKKSRNKLEISKNLEIMHTLITKKKVDDNLIYDDIVGMHGKKLEAKILFIYEDKKNQKLICETFEKLGINIRQVVSGVFAESLVVLNKKDMRIGTCHINIGMCNTSLTVYENGYPMLCSVLGIGGESISSDLSLGLRLSYAEAEEIKINMNTLDTKKRRVEEIVEARINYINNKINAELDRVKRRDLLPGGAILTGGTSELYKLENNMRYDLKIPIRKLKASELKKGDYLNSFNIRSFGIALLYDETMDSSIYIEYISKIYKFIYFKIKKYLP